MIINSINDITNLLTDEYAKVNDVRLAKLFLINNGVDENDLLLKSILELEQYLKRIYKSKEVNFLPIKNGFFSIGGRPTLDKILLLKDLGVNLVLTLLKKEEKEVEELGDFIVENNIKWIWNPLSASSLPTDTKNIERIRSIFNDLDKELEEGSKIYVHCAAGIHRTGAFTNAFLQYSGFSAEESKMMIKQMREVTAREAITKHWNWSKKFVSVE
ncbi:MAG: dual specificity protein phosphatase family protein [Bacteroidales bacterium]|nr:dual specificity protein phosphatase family protein [Bacteroidales bacterium]